MWKTKTQLRYEAELRERKRQLRARGIAHPAAPAGYDGLWLTECEREGCSRTFHTRARQRRYCSESCRRQVQAQADKERKFLEGMLLKLCAAENCQKKFVPKRLGHRFCSTSCRQKGYRQASDLSPVDCLQCGASLAGKTARAKYCTAVCRVRAARAREKVSATFDESDASFAVMDITYNDETCVKTQTEPKRAPTKSNQRKEELTQFPLLTVIPVTGKVASR